MKRVVTKIGDVFQVDLGDGQKSYFQYICNDLTQLNSDVIRVFDKKYTIAEHPLIEDIVSEGISFYAHAITSIGVKLGYWEKVGKSDAVGDLQKILFRDTNDCARGVNDPPILISRNWHVWRINEEFRTVGLLKGEHRNAEVGLVMTPIDIVERIRTGKYPGYYPGFE